MIRKHKYRDETREQKTWEQPDGSLHFLFYNVDYSTINGNKYPAIVIDVDSPSPPRAPIHCCCCGDIFPALDLRVELDVPLPDGMDDYYWSYCRGEDCGKIKYGFAFICPECADEGREPLSMVARSHGDEPLQLIPRFSSRELID